MAQDWKTTGSEQAPEGVAVMTKLDDFKGVRNEQIMKRQGNLWFAGDMYVYYQPTHWRDLTLVEKLKLKHDAEGRAIRQLEAAERELGLSTR